jgi:fused signal recognition particle receptor
MGLFERLKSGLSKTRELLSAAAALGPGLDPGTLGRIEEALLGADLGNELTSRVLEAVKRGPESGAKDRLVAALLAIAAVPPAPLLKAGALARPEVLLVLGVNGSGKTTTCGKLASYWRADGEKVLLAGADTFRAAAVEQLKLWSERAKVDFFSLGQDADPAAVAFDAVSKARAGGYTRLIIDTAGRLQTQGNLMAELGKVHRVCGKAMPGAPHRVILVLDGTAGQNMISQARLFNAAVPLSGLAVTKLDGSSKAGALLSVMHELKVPVQLLGVGEAAEDLQDFDAETFIRAMVG